MINPDANFELNVNSIRPPLDSKKLTPDLRVLQTSARKFAAMTTLFAGTTAATALFFTATPVVFTAAVSVSAIGFVGFAIKTAGTYKTFNRQHQERVSTVDKLNTNCKLTDIRIALDQNRITIHEATALLQNYILDPDNMFTKNFNDIAVSFLSSRDFGTSFSEQSVELLQNRLLTVIANYFNSETPETTGKEIHPRITEYIYSKIDEETSPNSLYSAYKEFIKTLVSKVTDGDLNLKDLCNLVGTKPIDLIKAEIENLDENEFEAIKEAFLDLPPPERAPLRDTFLPGNNYILMEMTEILTNHRDQFFSEMKNSNSDCASFFTRDALKCLKTTNGYAQACKDNIEFFETGILSRATEIDGIVLGTLIDHEVFIEHPGRFSEFEMLWNEFGEIGLLDLNQHNVQNLASEFFKQNIQDYLLGSLDEKKQALMALVEQHLPVEIKALVTTTRALIESKSKEINQKIAEIKRPLTSKKDELQIETLEKQLEDAEESLKGRRGRVKTEIENTIRETKSKLGQNRRVFDQFQKNFNAKNSTTIQKLESELALFREDEITRLINALSN